MIYVLTLVDILCSRTPDLIPATLLTVCRHLLYLMTWFSLATVQNVCNRPVSIQHTLKCYSFSLLGAMCFKYKRQSGSWHCTASFQLRKRSSEGMRNWKITNYNIHFSPPPPFVCLFSVGAFKDRFLCVSLEPILELAL